MFHVVNDPDQKILAELYAEIDIINSTEAGQPAMDGTIIVREVYQAVLDADGNPVLDDDGMFQKSRRLDLWVMEKRAGWGGDGGAGDWEFARFRPSGARIGGADNTECHECHISRKAAPATCREGNPTSIASCPWFTVGGQSELYRFHRFHAAAVTRVRGTVPFPRRKGTREMGGNSRTGADLAEQTQTRPWHS